MNLISIAGRAIGPGHPAYIIAELSANHGQSYERAARIVHAAKDSGADAIKLQTYTADTITIDARTPYFQIGSGTIWAGNNLHALYQEAHTPWEWQPKLKALAGSLGLHCFSTPFDFSAVDFLETLDVPAYKIASFELVDLDLIRRVAQTGKPLIMSTGMATLAEITDAVDAARGAGCLELALLKCNSGYPAPPEDMHLLTIPHMAQAFGAPVGLSDHTLGVAVPVAAVALGACIIEKHLTFARADGGPDSAFSLEPDEFKQMVDAVRVAEASLGRVNYAVSERERASRVFRRSLFIVQDTKAGTAFTRDNVRSIRPGHGLPVKHLGDVLGRVAARDLARGTPLTWDCVG
jgi:N-acetylneuraminate synthase